MREKSRKDDVNIYISKTKLYSSKWNKVALSIKITLYNSIKLKDQGLPNYDNGYIIFMETFHLLVFEHCLQC